MTKVIDGLGAFDLNLMVILNGLDMKRFLFILTLIIGSSYLITCSSDDDDEPAAKDRIIGKWQLTEEFLNGIALPLDDCELKTTIEFFENGSYTERDYEYDDDELECLSLPVSNGTWEYLGDSNYFISDIGIESLEMEFSGNTMTVFYSETIEGITLEIVVIFNRVN